MHSHLQITTQLCFSNETISAYRRVAFSLCTKVCEKKKAKLSEAVPYLLCKPVLSEKVLCVFVSLLPYYSFEATHKQIFFHIVFSQVSGVDRPNTTHKHLTYKRFQLNLRVILAGHSVAMVTYSVTKIIPTCSRVIGQFFDTMIVASIDKEWL